jgi:Domain of unknown function (DUF1996)
MYKIFYLVILFLFPFQLASAGSSSAGWKMECAFSHATPDDPIVSAAPGASHMHDFMGNLKTNAKSTYNSMLAGGTNCGLPEDTSGYWTPALYKNGVKINPSTTHIYYRREGSGTVKAFPADFRMIAGNHMAKTPSANPEYGSAIYWGCSNNSGGKRTAPPNCSTGKISLHVGFPSCWDGKNKDSMDHKSHVTYPSGGKCPSSHPVKLPRIIQRWEYTVGKDSSGIKLSSGPYYTVHGDFLNAWKQTKLEQLTKDCFNANKDCGVFRKK